MINLGAFGGVGLEIDPDKITASKRKCLEAETIKEILEQWGNGEIETDDAQVILLAMLISWTAVARQPSNGARIIRPGASDLGSH